MVHLDVGGSVLLLGERFSISDKTRSKTLPGRRGLARWSLTDQRREVLTNVEVLLCRSLDPSTLVGLSQLFTLFWGNLPGCQVYLGSDDDTWDSGESTEIDNLVIDDLDHFE